jgi:hypothetical protein
VTLGRGPGDDEEVAPYAPPRSAWEWLHVAADAAVLALMFVLLFVVAPAGFCVLDLRYCP